MRFEILKIGPAQYWWRIKGANNETMAHSETMTTKAARQNAIAVVKRDAAGAPVKDLTGE